MSDSFKKKKKRIAYGLFSVFLIGMAISGLSVFLAPNIVHAENLGAAQAPTKAAAQLSSTTCLVTGAAPTPCPGKPVAALQQTIWDGFITPSLKMVAVKSLLDFVSFATNKIAYEAAVYIANGGPGEGSMFYKKSATDAFKGFGKDIAGQAFADLSDITKSSFGLDLCAPPNPVIRLNLQLSIKQNYSDSGTGSGAAKPRCDFDSVSN